jgi:fatty-acyl-CoA synthase
VSSAIAPHPKADCIFSYVSGSSTSPLLGVTIGAHFDWAVAKWPSKEALVVSHQNVRWSFSDLANHVDRFAKGLVALGLRRGDRLGIWSPNCAEWVIVQMATAKVGVILVNINPAYRVTELEYALNKVGCSALVMAKQFKTSDYLRMIAEIAPEVAQANSGEWSCRRLPTLRYLICIDSMPRPGYYSFAPSGRSSLKRKPDSIQF